MASRRQLNHLTDQLRRAEAHDHGVGTVKTDLNDDEGGVLGALFDLESVCANPDCGHERGFHLMTDVGARCGFTGCVCADFEPQPELDDAHPDPEPLADPFAHFVGDPDEPGDPEEWPADGGAIIDELAPVTPQQWAVVEQMVAAAKAETEPIAQDAPVNAPSDPLSDEPGELTETSVLFPVVAAGHPAVALDRLLAPAHRVADIVDALEPMLAPPLAVQQLQILVEEAAAVEVTDADSYDRACDLYELLVENEKGIDETIGPVVGFFYKPWKAMCDFRARFAKPVAEQKKRLSDVAGAWQLAEKRRAAEQARRDAEAAAAAERARLHLVAEEAKQAAASLPAESSLAQMLEQTATQAQTAVAHVVPIPVPAAAPPKASAGTKNRARKEAVLVNADTFYKALAEDSTRRVAAPLDQAYLNKQANELGAEFSKRFPGLEAVDKGGLTANGRR